MACKLCRADRALCRSHIVPEFLHKDLYDAKHRARQIRMGRDTPGYLQKGLRDLLLCLDCEQLINDWYEKPFLKAWRDGGMVPARLQPDGFHVACVDYATVKLFLLSVLFRAGVSTLGAFAGVRLGPHEERLRTMLLTKDPAGPHEYPVVGVFAVDENGAILPCVASPIPYRLFERRAYAFLFGGCEWTFFVANDPIERVRGVGIRPDGVALFGASLLRDLRTMTAMREEHQRRIRRRELAR